ncbi:1039_t:CDS:1, partial [Acaulospora morrowiae]
RCKDGDKCAYKHNPARVAVCKSWLRSDGCKLGEKCLLQHKESPHVVPYCRHFNHGLCINPKCHYTHVHVNFKAPYCPNFDKDKYCPKGEECKLKHEWRLANFDEDETEQTNASSSDSNELGKRKREDDLKRKVRIKQPGEEIDPFKAQFDYISLDYSTEPK